VPVLSPMKTEIYAKQMLRTIRKGTDPVRIPDLLNTMSNEGGPDRDVWLVTLWQLLSNGELELTERKRIRPAQNKRGSR
jgi:hypothetical protein